MSMQLQFVLITFYWISANFIHNFGVLSQVHIAYKLVIVICKYIRNIEIMMQSFFVHIIDPLDDPGLWGGAPIFWLKNCIWPSTSRFEYVLRHKCDFIHSIRHIHNPKVQHAGDRPLAPWLEKGLISISQWLQLAYLNPLWDSWHPAVSPAGGN